MSKSRCPTRDELRALQAAALQEDAAEVLIDHMSTCPSCQRMFDTICNAEDTFALRLRSLPAEDPFAKERECHEAIQRIQALGTSSDSGAEVLPISARDLGEYQLLNKLGEGGMGAVYKAIHTKLKRVVALKVLPHRLTADERAIARFGREMEAVGRIDHPNIVRALDAREVDGIWFLVMEYVDGIDLGDLMRHLGPLPVADACDVIRQTAIGLQTIHENGLVHRDIKPSNLMLTPRGEIKILDLGLALLLVDDPGKAEMTAAGQPMGTPDYIAPEQVSDAHNVDRRADIYSLGCTLFGLLTGRAPFSGPEHKTTIQKIVAHLQAALPSVTQSRPDVPEEVAAILKRMTAKGRQERFATAGEVADALAPFAVAARLPALLARATTEAGATQVETPGPAVTAASPPMAVEPQSAKQPDVGLPPNSATPNARRRFPRRMAMAIALGGLAAAILLGIVIKVFDKEGKPIAELHFKDGASATVGTDEPTVGTRPVGESAAGAGSAGVASKDPAPSRPADQERPRSMPNTVEPSSEPSGPLSAMALVTRPAALPGVRSWTVDTEAHHSRILALAYHPAGEWLASGGHDGAIRLWPQAAGPAKLLCGHDGAVQTLAWSPDGDLLASGGWDAAVRLWDPQSGRLLWSYVPDADFVGYISDLAWSPDGARLAFVTDGGIAEVLDVAARRSLRVLGNVGCSLTTLAWAADGKTLAWAGTEIRVSSADSGDETLRISQEGSTFVGDVAWTADGGALTSLHSDGTVRVWDAQVGKMARQIPLHPMVGTPPRCLSPGATRLATNDVDSSATEIWDVGSGQKLLTLDPKVPFAAVAWSPDQGSLAIGTAWGSVHICDLASGSLLRTIEGSTAQMVCGAAWTRDGEVLATAPVMNELRVWDAATGRQTRRLPTPEVGDARALAWSPDGERIAESDGNKSVYVWDAGWGKLVHRLDGHATTVCALSWAPRGDRLASGDAAGDVMLWDANSGKPWKALRQGGHGREVRFLAWSPDSERLAVDGIGNKVEVWEAQLGRVVQTIPLDSPPLSAAWSPDGISIACSRRDDRNVLLWDTARGGPQGLIETGIVARGMAWRPDGQSLVLTDIATIEQWDSRLSSRLGAVKTGLPQMRRFHPNAWDYAAERLAEFSPDARHCASAGHDGAIRLLDAATGQAVRVMLQLSDGRFVTISPDGHFAASPDAEKQLVYVIQTDDGQETLLPDRFSRRFGWKNDPNRASSVVHASSPTE